MSCLNKKSLHVPTPLFQKSKTWNFQEREVIKITSSGVPSKSFPQDKLNKVSPVKIDPASGK